RAVRAERRRTEGTGVPLEREPVGMAEAMDVAPLPAAEVGPGAVEQAQGGGDVALPPLLVGHLDGPSVFDGGQLLSSPPVPVPGAARPPPGRPPPPPRPLPPPPPAQGPAPPTPPSRTASSPSVYAAASVGFRRTHLATRSTTPAGRTLTGSPAANRPRSAASAPAVEYRSAGSFSRHFRQMISRSRGVCGFNRDGGSGGHSRTCWSASATEAPR